MFVIIKVRVKIRVRERKRERERERERTYFTARSLDQWAINILLKADSGNVHHKHKPERERERLI